MAFLLDNNWPVGSEAGSGHALFEIIDFNIPVRVCACFLCSQERGVEVSLTRSL